MSLPQLQAQRRKLKLEEHRVRPPAARTVSRTNSGRVGGGAVAVSRAGVGLWVVCYLAPFAAVHSADESLRLLPLRL